MCALCLSLRVRNSGPMRSSRRLAREGWVRSIVAGTHDWNEQSRSKYCPIIFPLILSRSSVSSAKRALFLP
jgi:hypothetical protein